MTCTKCGTLGELRAYTTFQYYYCTTCKDEVMPQAPSGPVEDLALSTADDEGMYHFKVSLHMNDRILDTHSAYVSRDLVFKEEICRVVPATEGDIIRINNKSVTVPMTGLYQVQAHLTLDDLGYIVNHLHCYRIA